MRGRLGNGQWRLPAAQTASTGARQRGATGMLRRITGSAPIYSTVVKRRLWLRRSRGPRGPDRGRVAGRAQERSPPQFACRRHPPCPRHPPSPASPATVYSRAKVGVGEYFKPNRVALISMSHLWMGGKLQLWRPCSLTGASEPARDARCHGQISPLRGPHHKDLALAKTPAAHWWSHQACHS